MTRLTDYRYDECGLDNVILKDLPVVTDDMGEEVITIPHVNRLHKLLLLELAMKASALNGKELRFIRTELGKTQAEFARMVGCDAQTIGRWERGETSINQSAEMVIRTEVLRHLHAQLLPMEEMAELTMPAAVEQPLLIDASNPQEYRPLRAAA